MGRGLTSSFRTRGDRRPRQAIISAPPIVPLVIAAPYSNDRGSRMELARRESRWVSERLAFYRDMALSNHGTPLNLSAGERRACSTHRHDPDLSGLFSLPVRVRQHPKGDLSESSKHFLNTSFSRTHFRGDDVCKSASIQFTAAPSQRSQ